MEVPIINNLNDNGDRQRPRGKDVFKDQQKESEVNARGVCAQSVTTAYMVQERAGDVCVGVCVCCCCWGAFIPDECPFHAVSRCLGSKACSHAGGQAGRHRGVILATGSYK